MSSPNSQPSQPTTFEACNSCLSEIKRVIPLYCSKCKLSYHPGCARQVFVDDMVKICCGPRSRSSASSFFPSRTASICTQQQQKEQQLQLLQQQLQQQETHLSNPHLSFMPLIMHRSQIVLMMLSISVLNCTFCMDWWYPWLIIVPKLCRALSHQLKKK